jgi:hypothetical protein
MPSKTVKDITEKILENDIFYEKSLVPMIKELNVGAPGNVMNWKITKYKNLLDYMR